MNLFCELIESICAIFSGELSNSDAIKLKQQCIERMDFYDEEIIKLKKECD